MGCIPGRFGRLQTSFDNGNNFDLLGGTVDISLNGDVGSLECTSKDDNGISSFIPGNLAFTMSVSMRWDEDQPTQVDLIETLIPSPVEFKIKFMLEDKAGRRQFEADAFLTNYSPTSPLDDVTGLDVELQLSNVIIGIVP